MLDPAAAEGPRTVTVTTVGGTSGPQGFTISLPPPTLTSVVPNQGILGTTVAVMLTGTNFAVGATTVAVSGGNPQTFTVPAGVVSITIVATGAQGGLGLGQQGGTGGAGGLGGRTTATVSSRRARRSPCVSVASAEMVMP